MDDWTSVVERVVSGNAAWLDGTYRRPFLFMPFLIQYQIFGLNVIAYYVVLFLTYILLALLLYKIIARLPIVHRHTCALTTALLFLVYPTNYTHMWLIMLGVHCVVGLTLGYAYLLLRYVQVRQSHTMAPRRRRWLLLAAALVCLLLSLGIYEAQIGVASAWALVLYFLYSSTAAHEGAMHGACGYRQSAYWRRLSVLTPLGIMGAFALWRTFGYQMIGIGDRYLTQVDITPQHILSRLLLGYKITLAWGWTYPLQEVAPWISGTKVALLILVCVTILALWLSSQIGKRTHGSEAPMTNELRRAAVRQYLCVAAVGLLLLGAGYVPVAFVFLPSLADIGSRFNLFATIGGATTIAALLMIAAVLLARSAGQIRILVLAAAAPFILLGVVTQASVQHDNRVAWREQQAIWRSLFAIAPDFADNTFVLMVLPGFQERMGFYNWRRTPLSASWEISSGLRLLYDNTTLSGDVVFPDSTSPVEAVLQADGVLTQENNRHTPYARVVVYLYENGTGDMAPTLRQLEELPGEWIEGAGDIKVDMLCAHCVIDGDPPQRVPARSLVQHALP